MKRLITVIAALLIFPACFAQGGEVDAAAKAAGSENAATDGAAVAEGAASEVAAADSSPAVGAPHHMLWDRANTAYLNGKYEEAAAAYDSIISLGYSSAKLYYNMGNASFREGKIGKAILYYNKAHRLQPMDRDTEYNLAVANSYVKDQIEVVPQFFLVSWMGALCRSFSSNGWAVMSIVFFALTLAGTLFYLRSGALRLRKIGFYVALCSSVFFLAALTFSISQRNELLNSDDAIVMSTAAPVKSSPDNASKDIFILHEGTKVRVVSSLNQWREIQIADGNKGWILETAIETIR